MREADSKTTAALREDCDKLLEEVGRMRAIAYFMIDFIINYSTISTTFCFIGTQATRRHKVEIKNLREQLAIEKESWESMFMRRQDASLAEKVRTVDYPAPELPFFFPK